MKSLFATMLIASFGLTTGAFAQTYHQVPNLPSSEAVAPQGYSTTQNPSTATQGSSHGCLKGGAVGAVGGHLLHHPILGAMAGCAIGMHEAHKEKQLSNP